MNYSELNKLNFDNKKLTENKINVSQKSKRVQTEMYNDKLNIEY